MSSSNVGDITNFKFVLPASADNYFSAIRTFISKYEDGSITLTIDGATSIPAQTFFNKEVRYKLMEVVIGDSVTNIGNDAFKLCTYLQKLTLGRGLTSLGASVFYGCKELTEIEIPDSVTSMGDSAFEYCSYLQKVTLGKGLTSLGASAFFGCSKLTEIEMPDSLISIGQCCFCDCIKLESIKLSASITVLNDNVFAYCTSLKSLIIPNSVTTISNYATNYCNELTTVYYTGTANEWNNITIGYSNAPLTTATIYYYSETQPSTTGNYWRYYCGVPTIWK